MATYQDRIDRALRSWEEANLSGDPELDNYVRQLVATWHYDDPAKALPGKNVWHPDPLRVVAEISRLPKAKALAVLALFMTWLPSIEDKRTLARYLVEREAK